MGAINFSIKTAKLSEICTSIDTTGADAVFTFSEKIIPLVTGYFNGATKAAQDPFTGLIQYVPSSDLITFDRQNAQAFTGAYVISNGTPFYGFKTDFAYENGSAALVAAGFANGAAYLAANSYIKYLSKLPQ